MTADREHIATLERMLAKKEQQGRSQRDTQTRWLLPDADVTVKAVALLEKAIQHCHAEAAAIEWALEFVTRSER